LSELEYFLSGFAFSHHLYLGKLQRWSRVIRVGLVAHTLRIMFEAFWNDSASTDLSECSQRIKVTCASCKRIHLDIFGHTLVGVSYFCLLRFLLELSFYSFSVSFPISIDHVDNSGFILCKFGIFDVNFIHLSLKFLHLLAINLIYQPLLNTRVSLLENLEDPIR